MDKKLYFITGNEHKFEEVKLILQNIERLEIELPEIQEMDARKIIEAKLKEAFNHHQGEFIVEDVSLSIEGLKGLPGPLVKWFLKTVGPEGIAKMAGESGNAKATACVIYGYARNADDIHFFENSVNGKIVAPRGQSTFGWNQIFEPDGYGKTFSELKDEDEGFVLMRHGALEKLKGFINNNH